MCEVCFIRALAHEDPEDEEFKLGEPEINEDFDEDDEEDL